jgi:hypothetical protein
MKRAVWIVLFVASLSLGLPLAAGAQDVPSTATQSQPPEPQTGAPIAKPSAPAEHLY